ncbi:MAG: FtsX-like permease family protein [Planctomycetota bacterium]
MHNGHQPLTLFRMTTRNLYRRPMRTTLTALGVAVGVVAIVTFSIIVNGLWESVDVGIHFDDADLVVLQSGVAADIFSLLDEHATGERLRAVPGVAQAVPALWHVLPVEEQPFVLMLGARLDDLRLRKGNLVAGRPPAGNDEITIGTIAARVMEKGVGDTVDISGEEYKIVGIFKSGVVFFDGAVAMSLPTLQRLAGKEGRVTVFQVHIEAGMDRATIADRIEETCPDVAAIGEAGEYKKVDQGLEIAREMVWAVSFVAIVIGSIIITNTMWMSVLERTREIGVLRAVGWSRKRIVLMIVLEAAGVGVIACLIGSVAGSGLAELTTRLPTSELFIDPKYSLEPFMLALGVAVLLSVVGALLPAWRAAHVSPAEALRYE